LFRFLTVSLHRVAFACRASSLEKCGASRRRREWPGQGVWQCTARISDACVRAAFARTAPAPYRSCI